MGGTTRVMIAIAFIATTSALWADAARGQSPPPTEFVHGMVVLAATGPGQEALRPQPVDIPADATSLEGVPTVRIDSTDGAATRHVLTAAEAEKARLMVKVANGLFYWTTRDNRLLRLNASGEFTYLSSEPGQYIRLTRLNEKISYVEHVDLTSGSVAWFGELKIIVGK